MIVFALKAIFLIGVMSWYSAAIFSMINNYFRQEFNEYIKINPPDAYKSNTIPHTDVPIPSNNKREMPPHTSQYSTAAAVGGGAVAIVADDDNDDEKSCQTMTTMMTTTTSSPSAGHFNQLNNEILTKHPLIPIIIIEPRLVYSDNGRCCHFDEYVVELLSRNSVCMRRQSPAIIHKQTFVM